ncbi:MAG: hypothetical protein JST28_04775 [Acidobacteria bacterium]|nr:hypothetical protein [Acidobacteriota bacterium]
MTTSALPLRVSRSALGLPILVGGFIAGLLDMTSAYITFGRMMPLGIAGGLIGAAARHPSAAHYILGLAIHYLIAFSAATAYCLAGKKLPFLREHFFVCGLVFGIVFFLFMNLVILPLSAYHAMGPYTYRGLVQGLLAHMFLIGLPISTSLRMLSK